VGDSAMSGKFGGRLIAVVLLLCWVMVRLVSSE